MAAVALAWLLACLQRNVFITVIGTLIFVFLSGLHFFNPFDSTYLQTTILAREFTFPNTILETVTEAQAVSFSEILVGVTGQSKWV